VACTILSRGQVLGKGKLMKDDYDDDGGGGGGNNGNNSITFILR
jgi:hypothetical protein